VTFSPDGKLLASGGAAATGQAEAPIKLWDVAGQKEAKSLKGHEMAVTGVVFAPDSSSVYSIGFDRLVREWNVASGAETKKMGPTPDDLYGIALARDGKSLATSGYGGNVTVWNLADGKPTFTRKLKFGAYCIAFTPDGKALITGHDNQSCYITPLTPTTP
jgi:WD40 repeat protein